MRTRRDFLKRTVLAAGLTAASLRTGPRAEGEVYSTGKEKAGHLGSARIKSAIRREETLLRPGGMGDGLHMSWARDDRQLVAVCDGTDWSTHPKAFYNSRLYAMSGSPRAVAFEEVASYPDLMRFSNTAGSAFYFNFGTLAVDGRIYQFLSTFNHDIVTPDGRMAPDTRFIGAKLIYSPDGGHTWHNQDGSTPVIWERWQDRSRQNMIFFEESQDAFSMPSILQMGRDYTANRDGYIYVYAPNGNADGTMNEVVMFRVLKTQVLKREAYQFFGGSNPNGSARWTRDIEARVPLHTFPRGWVNSGSYYPFAWMPSVVYNAPLSRYLMASWGPGCGPDGTWYGKPSYLGFWVANHPWGPWTQIHEETAWTPDRDPNSRAFSPQISPKWIAADGTSFWLVWSEYQPTASQKDYQELEEDAKHALPFKNHDDEMRLVATLRKMQPYRSFNTQRVDLVI